MSYLFKFILEILTLSLDMKLYPLVSLSQIIVSPSTDAITSLENITNSINKNILFII